jgi:mannose-6-phosphate isomerase-like protein (cupin superfamily)
MTELPGVVRIASLTDPLRVLLSNADSGGDVGIAEMEMLPDGGGPPLHRHPNHGEGFWVVMGTLTFQVGGDVVTGGPGTWVYAPRNAPHTLANFGPDLGRVLCVFAPGGFERRFERMLAEKSGQALGPELAERSPQESGTVLLGPPLSPRPGSDTA